jgi:hypothetical protein
MKFKNSLFIYSTVNYLFQGDLFAIRVQSYHTPFVLKGSKTVMDVEEVT